MQDMEMKTMDDDMTYKERVEAFHASCRVYRQEKNILDKLLRREAIDAAERQYISYIREDVSFVETTLEKIRRKCGPNARVMIWRLYVNDETQLAVAEDFHLTRRQLQYSVDKWLKAAFDED